MSELCEKCGSGEFAVARNMIGTRICKCGHRWDPITGNSIVQPPFWARRIKELEGRITALREALEKIAKVESPDWFIEDEYGHTPVGVFAKKALEHDREE